MHISAYFTLRHVFFFLLIFFEAMSPCPPFTKYIKSVSYFNTSWLIGTIDVAQLNFAQRILVRRKKNLMFSDVHM